MIKTEAIQAIGSPKGSDVPVSSLAELAAGVAGRLLDDAHDVEDVAQESVTRLLANWDRVAGYARPWVVRVATNLAIDRIRHDFRYRELLDTDDPGSGDSPTEDRVDLARAVSRLPVRQRQVVVLRLLCDVAEAEVAVALGCSQGSVKRHLHRATAALRRAHEVAERAGTASTTQEKSGMTSTLPTWLELGFVPATEPERGWPDRPWDHWFVAGPDGKWDRVAVDPKGDPVLDADGDEVMTGPGFGHAVVKVMPGRGDERPPRPRPDVTACGPGVAGLLERAADGAAFHGHPWVGDEHLALALAERGLLTFEGVPVQPEEVDEAIARFYDGPWTAARLRVVAARRKVQPFTRQPDDTRAWTWALETTIEAANAAGSPPITDERTVAAALMSKEHSLPVTLLRQARSAG